jgi:membrane protein implicated in regulation of membrane protease activity
VYLAIGAMWLIVAIVLYNTDFVFAGFTWRGSHPPAIAFSLFRVLFRMMPPLLFLGWVAPVLFGLWLLWKK